MTREALAQRLGYSVSALRKVESDERRPSRQMAERLAECLKLPEDQRSVFLRVARGQLLAEHLQAVETTPPELPTPRPSEPTAHPRPLPVALTPLVGRETELWALAQLLNNPQCRLLNLVGPGGIGKTRLVLAAAAQQDERHGMTVAFAPLAGLSSPGFIVPAIAEALGLVSAGPSNPWKQLLDYLSDKQILIVLDNLEHLAEVSGMLRELLQQAPGVKLLATSREVLNLPGEWVFDVQGLPYPENPQDEELETYDAVILFVQQAQRAHVGFSLGALDRQAVWRICRRVEGMPLAIELAAAWVRMLTCDEIAEEIERRFEFLASAWRGVPERHRSIRAAFDHSWNLLTHQERQVLRRLAVFKGGFGRAAAEVIAGADLVSLSALVDKSLLRRQAPDRYDLHELIRQYTVLHLGEDPAEEAQTYALHAQYYLNFIRAYETALQSQRQKAALAELTDEVDNLRAAWQWAAQNQPNDLRQAAWTIYYVHELRSLFGEAEAMFLRAQLTAEASDLANQATQGYLMAFRGYFTIRQNRNAEALPLLRQSVARLKASGDQLALADALWACGLSCWLAGEFNEADQCLSQSHDLNTSLERSWHSGLSATFLGLLAHDQEQYQAAHNWLCLGLEIARTTGDPRMIAFTSSYLCRTARSIRQQTGGEPMLCEGMALTRDTDDRFVHGLVLEQVAREALERQDLDEARRLHQEVIDLYHEIGDHWSLSRALTSYGHLLVADGELSSAEDCFKESLEIAWEAGLPPNILAALVGLAEIRLCTGESADEQAYLWLFAASHHTASYPDTRQRARQLLAEIENRLDVSRLMELKQQAQEATLAEVIEKTR